MRLYLYIDLNFNRLLCRKTFILFGYLNKITDFLKKKRLACLYSPIILTKIRLRRIPSNSP